MEKTNKRHAGSRTPRGRPVGRGGQRFSIVPRGHRKVEPEQENNQHDPHVLKWRKSRGAVSSFSSFLLFDEEEPVGVTPCLSKTDWKWSLASSFFAFLFIFDLFYEF